MGNNYNLPIEEIRGAIDTSAIALERLAHQLQVLAEENQSLRLDNIRLKRAATLATSKTDDTGQWDQVETVRFAYEVDESTEYIGEAVVSIRKAVAQQDEFGVAFDDGDTQIDIVKCFRGVYTYDAKGYTANVTWDVISPYHKDFDLAVLRRLERAAIESMDRNTDHITFPGEERV